MAKKKITLEDLGEAIADLARGVGDRFDKVDDQLHRMDGQIRETREVLAQAIKDLELRFVAHASGTREEFDRLKGWMEEIDTRVSALEGKRHKKTA